MLTIGQAVPEPTPWITASGTALVPRLLRAGAIHSLLIVLAAVFLGPVMYALASSLKSPSEIFLFPPRLLPSVWRWGNYADAWNQAPFYLFYTNTMIITLLGMAGQIVSATFVAYGFARFRFPGRDILFLVAIATLILPEEVTLVPTFVMFRVIGWIDTWWPLIVPSYFGGGGFAIFLLRQFFLTIPRDLDEAAEIDGAGSLHVLWEIIVPLSRPAFATLAIFSFIRYWNEFLDPLIYLKSIELYTISLGLRFFQVVPSGGGPVKDHLLLAAALTSTLPIVVVFLIFQRQFVQGIVLTGIKG